MGLLESVVWDEFSVCLNRRFELQLPTSEDCVRYTLFATFLKTKKLKPENFMMEFPHPLDNRKKIDSVVQYGNEKFAIELKYHREIPSGKNAPRPQKAGKDFHDLRRLGQSGMEGVFVLISSGEMSNYYKSRRNGLVEFFDLKPKKILKITNSFFEGRSNTFATNAGGPFCVSLACLHSSKLSNEHTVRVFRVVLDTFQSD